MLKALIFLVATILTLSGGDRARAHDTIRFATESLPPFNYMAETGQVSGPAADIARLICEDLNWHCKFRLYPVKRLLHEISQGQVDVVFSLAHTPAREEHFFFSNPFTTTHYGFFVRADATEGMDFEGVADLENFEVGALANSNMLTKLQGLQKQTSGKGFRISEEIDLRTAFLKLSYNRYLKDRGAVFSNRDTGNWLIRETNISNVRYFGQTESINYHYAIPRNARGDDFAVTFNTALNRLFRDGRLLSVLRDYRMDMPPLQRYASSDPLRTPEQP